eukprot:3681943-Prymnesium_polylepis.1
MDDHQRLRNIKNCALYYERHKHEFLKRKLLRGIRKGGSVPYRQSCQRFGISVAEVIEAYQYYSANNSPSDRSRERYQKLLRMWT